MNLDNIIDTIKTNGFYCNGFGVKCKSPQGVIDIHYIAKAILKRKRKNSNIKLIMTRGKLNESKDKESNNKENKNDKRHTKEIIIKNHGD